MEGHAFTRAKKSHVEGVSALPKAGAKRLISLPLFLPYFSFRVFRPKIACQAPTPPKPLKPKETELAG
jgi:hypothetical protein